MLRIERTASRTYSERMADNLSALPLITREWTNYNPSDPGMTMLENLTLFETLQGSGIGSVGLEARLKLLKMMGFKPSKGKCARLLLSAGNVKRSIRIPASQRFLLGDLVFESKKPVDTGDHHLVGIYSEFGGSIHDFTYLCDRELKISAKIFGDRPREGNCIAFIADRLPEPGRETSFYIGVDKQAERNPIDDRRENIFAALKWECYTEAGFVEMNVRDYTGAFLGSGEIRLRMPAQTPAVYDGYPEKGYCIRATLSLAQYDICPSFSFIEAFLFEVLQKDTRAMCMTFQKPKEITIKSPFPEEGYVLAFGKEEKGSSYRRYELVQGESILQGRYCQYKRLGNGEFTLNFDKARFGYEPEKVKDAVRVVVYSEEIMRQYRVGQVLGYDDQELELPLKHIVTDTFCLIAKRVQNGEEIYDFVRPERHEEDALTYHLLEDDGRIIIEDAGEYIGAELFMGGIAVTEGRKGNVRAGNYFDAPGLTEEPLFFNPGPGTGGCFREKFEDVRERFRKDVFTPYTCVTAQDYEEVVKSTPALCIRKAKAVMDEMENLVRIAVMPGTGESFPKLSDIYQRVISERLSERRLITTRFQIIPPVYVGVSVKSTVYVKRHYTDCRRVITERFRRELDYPGTEKNFGDTLKFEEVFRAVEELDCVEYIYDLSMIPERRDRAELKDSDIYPAQNCLLYLGHLELEIITYEQ